MKIITVSYRLPLSVKRQKGKVSITKSAGGLATAILSYSEKSNSNLSWVGIADFEKELWEENQSSYSKNFDIEPVYLNKKLDHNFYTLFSNSVLWSLFHYFPSFVEYNDEAFEAYKIANEIVAQKIIALYQRSEE